MASLTGIQLLPVVCDVVTALDKGQWPDVDEALQYPVLVFLSRLYASFEMCHRWPTAFWAGAALDIVAECFRGNTIGRYEHGRRFYPKVLEFLNGEALDMAANIGSFSFR